MPHSKKWSFDFTCVPRSFFHEEARVIVEMVYAPPHLLGISLPALSRSCGTQFRHVGVPSKFILSPSAYVLRRSLVRARADMEAMEARAHQAESAEASLASELRNAEAQSLSNEGLISKCATLEERLSEMRAEQVSRISSHLYASCLRQHMVMRG